VTNLREVRRMAGFTQMKLAQQSRVSRFRICTAEQGYLTLRPDEVEAIKQALAPEVSRIVSGLGAHFQAATDHSEPAAVGA
jgi:DNA-binding XRE family transcriptional regulator